MEQAAVKVPIWRDIVERVAATFVVVLIGEALAGVVGWADWAELDNWKAWANAALIAALTLLKTLIASRLGQRSASLDPAVGLRPIPVDPAEGVG
jgi:uncharacterized protein (DUF983 family)